jgi:hypothetical protein
MVVDGQGSETTRNGGLGFEHIMVSIIHKHGEHFPDELLEHEQLGVGGLPAELLVF